MSRQKLKLDDLRIQSFVTTLNDKPGRNGMEHVIGGTGQENTCAPCETVVGVMCDDNTLIDFWQGDSFDGLCHSIGTNCDSDMVICDPNSDNDLCASADGPYCIPNEGQTIGECDSVGECDTDTDCDSIAEGGCLYV
ncbi:MAG: pinensin family lanthipeptide [Phaeodactylibacter sp.]|nr:pinensin family lanthipeptide [Phaeodactylibacter sp.]